MKVSADISLVGPRFKFPCLLLLADLSPSLTVVNNYTVDLCLSWGYLTNWEKPRAAFIGHAIM